MNHELNAAVAEYVMGWRLSPEGGRRTTVEDGFDCNRCPVCGWPITTTKTGCMENDCSMRPKPQLRFDRIPDFSGSIAMAWPLVEKCNLDLIQVDDGWMVGVGGGYTNSGGAVDENLSPFAIAKTAPEAICRAALKAVGVEVPT